VDSIPRHVAGRSTPSLYPLRQPHPTSPSRRNRNNLRWYADYSNGGYQLGLILSRKHNAFIVPVQTLGLPDLSSSATQTPIFWHGRPTASFLLGHLAILDGSWVCYQYHPQALLDNPRSSSGMTTSLLEVLINTEHSTNPGPPELVLTNHAFLTARDVTDPIINDCQIRNREDRKGIWRWTRPTSNKQRQKTNLSMESSSQI
jgi:hypothetical protein